MSANSHQEPAPGQLMTFPLLGSPPIDEVVCGFVFEPVAGLDVMDFGVYADERRGEYPRRALHPAISDKLNLLHRGPPPVRAWLVSESDEVVLQLQNDRFYLNWRARGGDYPRFRDHDGVRGVKSLALDEFDRFAAFCCSRASVAKLDLVRIELTKVDKLVRGGHWSDYSDLATILRVVTVFDEVKSSEPRQLSLKIEESDGDAAMTTTVTVNEDAAKIESTCRIAVDGDLSGLFDRANLRLNDVFFGLLSNSGLERFEGRA